MKYVLYAHRILVLQELKVQWDDGGGKNTAGPYHWRRCRHSVAYQVSLCCSQISAVLPLHAHIIDHTNTRFRLAQSSTCTGSSRKQLWLKSGSVCIRVSKELAQDRV